MGSPKIWITLFVIVCLIAIAMITTWNIVLVNNYYEMWELAKAKASFPWLSGILGTFGFLSILSIIILFFSKLLKEMRLNILQSEFLAQVSHELKTPITSLMLTSNLLRNNIPNEQKEILWKNHDKELNRLQEDVSFLLEAARFESSRIKLDPQIFQLEDWLSLQWPLWKQRLNNRILERVGDPLKCYVRMDERLFLLAIHNLLDNACKYSHENSIIKIKTQLSPKTFEIIVSDEGIGFDEKFEKKIFKKFFRIPGTNRKGTGLGLYLVQKAVSTLRWKIKATSNGPGKGSSFSILGKVFYER